MLGYSLLFAPLAALAGPRRGRRASPRSPRSRLFAPLARAAAPSPGAAALATWLFPAGVLSNVVIGRMPFTLGIALAVGAWLCAGGRRRVACAAAVLALACVLASPVAGVFLALAARGARCRPRARGARRRRDAGSAARRSSAARTMALLFPEGGDGPLRRPPRSGRCCVVCRRRAALLGARRGARCWAGALLYLVVLVAAFAIPTPFGQNALRPGVAARAGAARARRPRRGAPRARDRRRSRVALLYLQWLPAVRAVAEAHGDPSTAGGVPRRGARLPATTRARARRARRGAAHAQPLGGGRTSPRTVPLARGWERQLDQKANPLFYDGRAADAGRATTRWLRENAVRWVALPERAARLLRARRRRELLERGAAVPASSVHESPRLADLGGARHGAAGLGRRAAARGRPGRLRGRGRRADRACASATRRWWSSRRRAA